MLNDLGKLAFDENVREHDRVVSPQDSLVRSKWVGKHLLVTFFSYNANVQVYINCQNACTTHHRFCYEMCRLKSDVNFLISQWILLYCRWDIGNTTTMYHIPWILIDYRFSMKIWALIFVYLRTVLIYSRITKTYIFCSHLYFSKENEMFNLRIICYTAVSMTSWIVHK